MKKRAIAVVLVWALFLCFVWQFRTESYADPFTASQIASTAYAMMQNWGVSFTAGSATASGMNDFMTNQVEDYVNSQGGSIADVFIGNIAVDVAGKLVVTSNMYNSIAGFVNWLTDKFSLSDNLSDLTTGQANGVFFPTDFAVDMGPFGISVFYEGSSKLPSGTYLRYCHLYVNGTTTYNGDRDYYSGFTGTQYYTAERSGNSDLIYFHPGVVNRAGTLFYDSIASQCYVSLTDSLKWSGEDYVAPTVLNPDKEWTGTIGGYSSPDTNLEDLLGDIDQAVADNNLVVDGEVIDVPIPPSPQPTVAPDIPLQDVPWEGLNDLIDNSTDAISETIGEAASDITGAIEGTQEAVESLEETITESLDVPAASEITGRKFDLSTLFPFCIPFDIYRMLQAFDGTPEAPHVQLPFVIQSIGFSYTFDLDFSAFNSVAAIMRAVEFIAFGIFLAFSTSKVIRW